VTSLGRVTTPSTSPPDRVPVGAQNGPAASGRGVRFLAAAVCLLQALALLSICIFYALGLIRGESGDAARTIVSIILIALFAGALGVLAWAWWRGFPWPVTPTVLWNALLLPVAWGLFQGGRGILGSMVLAVAVAGIIAALASGARRDVPWR
jgi:hypothetical protein